MYNYKPMTRENELLLGEGSKPRPAKRRAGAILTALLGVSLSLLLACSPAHMSTPVEVSGAKKQPSPTPVTRYDSNPLIAETQRGLEEAYGIRPDCFITDVDTELVNLSEGKDTYMYRPLSDTVDSTMRNVLLASREAYREILQKKATDIQNLSNKEVRAFNLARFYMELGEVNIEIVGYLPEGDEQGKELRYLAQCDAVKVMSLVGPYAIEEIRQNGSVTPTPSPFNRKPNYT